MTISNRLATRETTTAHRHPLTALEWAGEALERGLPKHFQMWMDEAQRRGEVGRARYVQWDGEGHKVTLKVFDAVIGQAA